MFAAPSRTRAPGPLQALGVCACLLLLLLAQPAAAAVNLDKLRDFDFGTWSPGSGDAVASQDFCVETDRGGVAPPDWAAQLEDPSGTSSTTQYRLANRSGTASVLISVRFVDLRTGIAELLQPGTQTAFDKTGGTRNCPRGLNGRLEVRIDAASLTAAEAGRLEGDFRFSAASIGADSDSFRIRIDVPDLMQISDLDDIPLGEFPGTGDMVGFDDVCVYRNDASRRYELEAFGQGTRRAFELVEAGGASLPFEVDYDDGSGYAALRAGRALRAGGADPSSVDCSGARNGSIRVTVREADLMAAQLGAYAGTLTLTVAPI
ncbi:MAG TPA: hypothetical protein VLA56_11570 [Pseudomonadales bacterium]|nr:hypothetical protein [Pseudomonadales bacterium]